MHTSVEHNSFFWFVSWTTPWPPSFTWRRLSFSYQHHLDGSSAVQSKGGLPLIAIDHSIGLKLYLLSSSDTCMLGPAEFASVLNGELGTSCWQTPLMVAYLPWEEKERTLKFNIPNPSFTLHHLLGESWHTPMHSVLLKLVGLTDFALMCCCACSLHG